MKTFSCKKWLFSFFVMFLCAVLLLSAFTYLIDPCFQFRVKDKTYYLSVKYQSAGIIKNYDYDTILIGSSMVQNFNMDVMREKLNCKPIHIGMGGMNLKEMQEYLKLAQKSSKANNYYLCIDIFQFSNDEESENLKYLFNSTPLDFVMYSLAYESWTRFIPTDLAIVLLKKTGIKLPEIIEKNTLIDNLGSWKAEFGEKIVIDNYLNSQYSVSKVDTNHLLERMKNSIDLFFDSNSFEDGTYTFFLPPYSSLYWFNAEKEGYFDAYLDAIMYFIKKANEAGCTVFDFQAEDFTVDLNYYKDTTHYKPEINDWMVDCFADNSCLVTCDSFGAYAERITYNTKLLIDKYPQLAS